LLDPNPSIFTRHDGFIAPSMTEPGDPAWRRTVAERRGRLQALDGPFKVSAGPWTGRRSDIR